MNRLPLAGIWLWISLVGPSAFVVHKYAGWTGLFAYACSVALVLARLPRLPVGLSNRSLLWLALATFALVLVVFVVAYPVVNSHVPNRGSDDDDAYNVGALALLEGQSPYAHTTYLGNVLHQFPGAFILAVPFVLLGTSALQNLFWLPAFFFAVKAETQNGRTALQLAWLVLALSPEVLRQVVSGTGHVSNTIYVLLGLWWLIRTRHRDVAAAGWGIALASRANFLLLLPLAFGWLRQHAGLPAAWRATAIAGAVCAGLTLPFYFHDPAHFGPLDAAQDLLRFDSLWPHLGLAVMVLTGVLSVVVAGTSMDVSALFRNCALVQAFSIVAALVLSTVQDGRPELGYAALGSFAAWFGFMAVASDRRLPEPAAR